MKKSFKEWAKDLGVKIYSGYLRKLEEDDFHIRKISAKEFIRFNIMKQILSRTASAQSLSIA